MHLARRHQQLLQRAEGGFNPTTPFPGPAQPGSHTGGHLTAPVVARLAWFLDDAHGPRPVCRVGRGEPCIAHPRSRETVAPGSVRPGDQLRTRHPAPVGQREDGGPLALYDHGAVLGGVRGASNFASPNPLAATPRAYWGRFCAERARRAVARPPAVGHTEGSREPQGPQAGEEVSPQPSQGKDSDQPHPSARGEPTPGPRVGLVACGHGAGALLGLDGGDRVPGHGVAPPGADRPATAAGLARAGLQGPAPGGRAVAVSTLWWLRLGGRADAASPARTLRDVSAALLLPPRPRRATRLRLVRGFCRGGSLRLVARLDHAPVPLGAFPPEPWPVVLLSHGIDVSHDSGVLHDVAA